jgi:hypothetical protein
MTRTVRLSVLGGVLAVGALVAGGVAIANEAPGPDHVVVEQGGPGGLLPVQNPPADDCPREGGTAQETSGAAAQL